MCSNCDECPAELAVFYSRSRRGWPRAGRSMKLEGSVCTVENGVERRKDGERIGERMTSGMNRDSRRSPVVVPLDEQAARCLLRPLARCGRRSLLRRRRHLLLSLAARMSHVMDVAQLRPPDQV